MREPYGKAVAPRTGPEPWRCVRKDVLQALVGVRVGWPLSRESISSPGRRGRICRPKATPVASLTRDATGPRAVRDPMHARRLFTQELGDPAFGRGAHDALDALSVGLTRCKISWVLDADIRGFFDAIDHEWLVKFVEHRIADRRVIRHIKKWLRAGVLEDGKRTQADRGTPQGGSISPLPANVYLHYAFDLWVHQWRRRQARGDVIVVRYADDFVVGFQHRSDAERFLGELRQRLAKFTLELHPDKTRLIEFGRFAAERRKRRGQRKPETFDFLGFTHACSRTRKGAFMVLRYPIKKRVRAKLAAIKESLRRRMNRPVAETGRWLQSVVSGWLRYYAVPRSYPWLNEFRRRVTWQWWWTLRRRGNKRKATWAQAYRLATRWLPVPRILHPYPDQRFGVRTQGRSPVR